MTTRSKLSAFLDGFASVLDLGLVARPVEYRGPEDDAKALRGDWERVTGDFEATATREEILAALEAKS